MLRLSALALGPLLVRAVPKSGSGIVDDWTAISHWLTKRYSDPSGKLAMVLTRTVDRAWRSLEIALAGEVLHRRAIESKADPALIEQIRQFITVASFPNLSPELRQKLGVEINNARQAEIIPGPVPSIDALATLIVRFLRGPIEETREADARELAALGPELRDAGFGTLAEFIELRSSGQQSLLVIATRYFLAREISSDLGLLRDLRFTRTELLTDNLRAGFDRLADALDRFTSVLIDLLAQLAVSSDPASSDSVSDPSNALPTSDAAPTPDPGFSINGTHLVSPIRSGSAGSRIAPCPVCLTQVDIHRSAGSWVSLRCDSCGTEFQATDGTAPAPLASKPGAGPEPMRRSVEARNLQVWIDSGEPRRWIDYRKGMWSEADFLKLTNSLRLSRLWPLDLNEVRRVLSEMSERYRTKGTNWGTPLARSPSPPSATTPTGLIRTSDVYRTIDGNLWVPCPICRSFNVEIPPELPSRSAGEVPLTCSGCGRRFVALLKKKPALLPPPPPPPPSFWGKVRKWFGE